MKAELVLNNKLKHRCFLHSSSQRLSLKPRTNLIWRRKAPPCLRRIWPYCKLCFSLFRHFLFLNHLIIMKPVSLMLMITGAVHDRPKTGDSSSDEEAKEVSAASCQERLQPIDAQQHPSPHTYRKSLRLSSDQIVRSSTPLLHNITRITWYLNASFQNTIEIVCCIKEGSALYFCIVRFTPLC